MAKSKTTAPAKKSAAKKSAASKPAKSTVATNPSDLPTADDLALVEGADLPAEQTSAPEYIIEVLSDPKVAATIKEVAAGRVTKAALTSFDGDVASASRAAGARIRYSNGAAIAKRHEAPPAGRLSKTFAAVMKDFATIASVNPSAAKKLEKAKAAWDAHHGHAGGVPAAAKAPPGGTKPTG